MNRVRIFSLVAVLVVASTFVQTSQQAPPREMDPISALTAELRAFRTELSTMAAASLRLQLLVARLQAQEQRVIYLDRLRSEAALRRSNVEQGRNELAGRLLRLSEAEIAARPAEERRNIEIQVEHEKSQLALQDRTLQQLQVGETDAVNALAQEQGRWNDFNARLEELERSLSQR
jgi:hypothetical protein